MGGAALGGDPEGSPSGFPLFLVAEANFFAIVIAIQSKAGGNLSEALGNLSRVLRRSARRLKGKVQAMSMEAKASAAIIASLPFIVAPLTYVTSPDYVSAALDHAHRQDRARDLGLLDDVRRPDHAQDDQFSRSVRRQGTHGSSMRTRCGDGAGRRSPPRRRSTRSPMALLGGDQLDKRLKAVAVEALNASARASRDRMLEGRNRATLRQRPGRTAQKGQSSSASSSPIGWGGRSTPRSSLVQAGFPRPEGGIQLSCPSASRRRIGLSSCSASCISSWSSDHELPPSDADRDRHDRRAYLGIKMPEVYSCATPRPSGRCR